MNNLEQLENNIGVVFKNKDLLLQALVHRSYLNENPKFRLGHNERLEYLGDAVLELVVTEHLYEKYPQMAEGEMTTLRAALVNAKTLSEISGKLGVNDFLLLSRGEAKDIGRARQYILANTFESIVGAMYIDSGIDAPKKFLNSVLLPALPKILEMKLYRDPKSLFQEEAQEKTSITPSYEVLKEWGPDHDKHFIIGVFLGKELVAEGEGPSKQAAQEDAARHALEAKGWG